MVSFPIGKRFNLISRVVDVMCLFLGEDRIFTNFLGESTEVANFSLHFQSQWRFIKDGKILLASNDIYEPFGPNVSDCWEYDLTDRPDDESSVFDVVSKLLTEKMQGAYVTSATLSVHNDLRLEFSDGTVFEQFILSSTKTEEWRIIDYVNDIHIVCYDTDGDLTKG